MSRDYEVGYGKPPIATRFKKGVSGNPKGRRRGDFSIGEILERELGRKIQIQEGGRTRIITVREALIKRLLGKAVAGELRSLQFIFSLMDRAAAQTTPADGEATLADAEILKLLQEEFGDGSIK